jgi:hypothetical protein
MLWPEFGFQFIPNARVSMDTPGASEPLVGLPLMDDVIKSLCVKALATLPREDFEKKLRRSFKQFRVELRKEVDTIQQRHAAHFVRFLARNSAHIICNTLKPDAKTASHPMPQAKHVEEDLDESSDSDRSDDEVDDLHQLQGFIKASRAIIVLRETLRVFVCPIDTREDGPYPKETKTMDFKEPIECDQHLNTFATFRANARAHARAPSLRFGDWFGGSFTF